MVHKWKEKRLFPLFLPFCVISFQSGERKKASIIDTVPRDSGKRTRRRRLKARHDFFWCWISFTFLFFVLVCYTGSTGFLPRLSSCEAA